jgi:cytochrome c oxidase subunit 2
MMGGLSRFTGLAALCMSALTSAQINRPKGVTPVSHDIYDLHIMGIWIVVGIMAVVYGIIIYSLIRHRKSKGAIASTFRDNLVPELFWTAVPLVIITIIATPSISALIEMHD